MPLSTPTGISALTIGIANGCTENKSASVNKPTPSQPWPMTLRRTERRAAPGPPPRTRSPAITLPRVRPCAAPKVMCTR
jgi:hypothetical protein